MHLTLLKLIHRVDHFEKISTTLSFIQLTFDKLITIKNNRNNFICEFKRIEPSSVAKSINSQQTKQSIKSINIWKMFHKRQLFLSSAVTLCVTRTQHLQISKRIHHWTFSICFAWMFVLRAFSTVYETPSHRIHPRFHYTRKNLSRAVSRTT